MKLENKISLILIIIFLTLSAIFFVTGFSALNLLNSPLAVNGLVTYVLLPLPLIGILVLIGIFIDRQIRKPLFFFIRWIDQLSLGVFKMPDTIKNFSLNKMRFSPFLELKSKLDGLTYQLNAAEKERKELEETRKNWTAGVTHDLKTPLSYIKGYAAMLHSEQALRERGIQGELQVVYIAEEGILRAQFASYLVWLQNLSLIALVVAFSVATAISALITATLQAKRDFPLRLAGLSWVRILQSRVVKELLMGIILLIIVVMLQRTDAIGIVLVTAVYGLLIVLLGHFVAARWCFNGVSRRRI